MKKTDKEPESNAWKKRKKMAADNLIKEKIQHIITALVAVETILEQDDAKLEGLHKRIKDLEAIQASLVSPLSDRSRIEKLEDRLDKDETWESDDDRSRMRLTFVRLEKLEEQNKGLTERIEKLEEQRKDTDEALGKLTIRIQTSHHSDWVTSDK